MSCHVMSCQAKTKYANIGKQLLFWPISRTFALLSGIDIGIRWLLQRTVQHDCQWETDGSMIAPPLLEGAIG